MIKKVDIYSAGLNGGGLIKNKLNEIGVEILNMEYVISNITGWIIHTRMSKEQCHIIFDFLMQNKLGIMAKGES